MPAKLHYATLAEVPEGIREFAKENTEDGSYDVLVDGADKVKEFRENNLKVVKERDDMKAALSEYEQVTGVPMPDISEGKLKDFAATMEALRETKQKVDDGKLVEDTTLEEAAAARVSEVHASYKEQIAQSAKDRDAHKARADAAEKRADAMQVENAVRLVASDADVAMFDKAVSLVMPRALNTFKVDEDGKITPKTADGAILYGQDGVTPMTIKEWLLKERDENDFLFKGAKGGSAAGNNDTSGGRVTQAELDKMSPHEKMKLARRMQAQS